MYFPVGWPKELSFSGDLQPPLRIACNRDRYLFAVLSQHGVAVWYAQPQLPLTYHRRDAESVEKHGDNVDLQWRADSSMLLVTTSRGYLLFFHLAFDAQKASVYTMLDPDDVSLRRASDELFLKEDIPPLVFSKACESCVEGCISAVVSVREELMVASSAGFLLRYRWNGELVYDYCVDLRRTPFSIDQQASPAVPIQEKGVYVVAVEYSPLVGGLAAVLNDGRAAFITASSLKFDPNSVQGVWVQGVFDATSTAVNHKYRLMVFGRACGKSVVCCLDDSTGGLLNIHSLVLANKDGPRSVGPIECLRWSPDGCVLAVCWMARGCSNATGGAGRTGEAGGCVSAESFGGGGGLALWSVFGALLFSSNTWRAAGGSCLFPVQLEWGTEGYNLWMVGIVENADDSGAMSDAPQTPVTIHSNRLLLMAFVKACQSVNPFMGRSERVCLQGSDSVYISHDSSSWLSSWQPEQLQFSRAGSQQWQLLSLPHGYIASNWPLRYVALDVGAQLLAVAGRCGISYCSLTTQRWSLFGNETQERDFVVTGGLVWWNSALILGCYNLASKRDEIRVYPSSVRLDNANLHTTVVDSQVLLLNSYHDTLITFAADCHVSLFHIYSQNSGSTDQGPVCVSVIQQVDVTALTPHPVCVISVSVSALRMEPICRREAGSELDGSIANSGSHMAPQSLLINVAGRLLMLQRDGEEMTSPVDSDTKMFTSTLLTPTVLASMVEAFWCPESHEHGLEVPEDEDQLVEPGQTSEDVLWINCGCHGMRLWLPLLPFSSHSTHSFMSKRIMLPLQCSIYPLSVKSNEAVIFGAESDVTDYSGLTDLPAYCVVERTSQVYLQHVLRQLLRRNLGHHAWQLAHRCRLLPYFSHALELLLHEVVEEEATCKEPIPDPLLPRVVQFIAEFPVYLDTVVRCARKTEMALWSYLFMSAGSPAVLFSRCLAENKLSVAASCLIILQNLESAENSRRYAAALLNACLEQCDWRMAREITRFLRSIDPSELESSREGVSQKCLSHVTPPVSPADDDLSMLYGNIRVRNPSWNTCSGQPRPMVRSESVCSDRFLTTAASTARHSSFSQQQQRGTPPAEHRLQRALYVDTGAPCRSLIDTTLRRHAARLLADARLRELGTFCAYMQFRLAEWLRACCRSASPPAPLFTVHAPVESLRQLHADFCWPYPVSASAVQAAGLAGVGSASLSSTFFNRHHHPHHSTSADGLVGSGFTSGMSAVRECSAITTHLMPNTANDSISVFSDCSNVSDVTLQPGSITSTTQPSSLTGDHVFAGQIVAPEKGTRQAEVQLRYMLQMMQEAECCEWCMLLSIVLRDSAALARCIKLAQQQKQHHSPSAATSSAVDRLTQHTITLIDWAATNCVGYTPLLTAFHRQLVAGGSDCDSPQSMLTQPFTALSLSPRASEAGCNDTSRMLLTTQWQPEALENTGDVTPTDKNGGLVIIGDGPLPPSSEQSSNCLLM